MKDNIFDKLWYGYSGFADSKPSAEQKEKINQAFLLKDTLSPTLSDEQIHLLNQYEDMITSASSIAEKEAFINGLRYGANFILTILEEK